MIWCFILDDIVLIVPNKKKNEIISSTCLSFKQVNNDLLNDCEKYGVNIGRKKYCGGLFADDVVLIAPSAKKFRNFFKIGTYK